MLESVLQTPCLSRQALIVKFHMHTLDKNEESAGTKVEKRSIFLFLEVPLLSILFKD